MAASWPWDEHTLWMSDGCMEIDERSRLSTVNPTTAAATTTTTTSSGDPCSATTSATSSSNTIARSRKRMRNNTTLDSFVDLDMNMGESDTNNADSSAGSVDVVMTRSMLKRRKRMQVDCLSNPVEDVISESEPQLSSAPSSEPVTPSDWPSPSPSTMMMLEPVPHQSYNNNNYGNGNSNNNSYPTAAIIYPHEESMLHEVAVSHPMYDPPRDDSFYHVWESQTLASELNDAAQLAWHQVYATSNRILHDAHWTRRHRLQPNVNITSVSSNHHLSVLNTADSGSNSISTELSSIDTNTITNSLLSSTPDTETTSTLAASSSFYASFNAMLAQLHRAREQRR